MKSKKQRGQQRKIKAAFWNRNGLEQTWKKLDNKTHFLTKTRNIVTALLEQGYTEALCDDQGYYEQSTLWFYGDL